MEKTIRKPNRIDKYDYSQNGAYFLTICTKDRKKILSTIQELPLPDCQQRGEPVSDNRPVTQLLWHGQIADKYIQQLDAFYDHLSVDKYTIMPDHIHLLIGIQHSNEPPVKVATRTSAIARFVGTFKRFCNKEYGTNIWQARYFDHVIRNQRDYDEIWQYIENNPLKWIIQKRGYE